MAAQRVAMPQDSDPVETVRWMGALQAQDYGQAVWGLGLRTAGATLQTIEAALQAGTIIRTWPMRGTVHFVPAEDAEWMLSLGAARMVAADTRRMGMLELDEEILARCSKIVTANLYGRKLLARPEVLQLFEDQGISTKNGRGYHILWRLAQAGTICIGPMLGKQQSFALLREWAPPQRQLGREEALATLAGRYFMSHGPATVQDFAWWSGLTMADCKLGLRAASAATSSTSSSDAPRLVLHEAVGNSELWYAGGTTGSVGNAATPRYGKKSEIHLLPGFDEYFLGYKDRSAYSGSDPEHMALVVPGNNGVFKPIIVMDGRVVGTWQRKILKTSVEIRLMPFDKIPRLADLARPAAEAYGAFLGLPLRLDV
jgi:hypothetical protein